MHWRDIARFWNKVDVGGDVACWPWKAGRFSEGYGSFSLQGSTAKAHAVAFELAHGRAPTKHVLHACDNPPCCNPAHLFEGTNLDNVRDKIAKGRNAKGNMSGTAKLTEEQVRAIRAAPGTQRAIAKQFGISQGQVWQIRSRNQWKHVL